MDLDQNLVYGGEGVFVNVLDFKTLGLTGPIFSADKGGGLLSDSSLDPTPTAYF